MPWKVADDGQEQDHIWIDSEGKEIAYDPAVTHSRLNSARSEAKQSAIRVTELQEQVGSLAWVGDDPEATKDELEKLRAAHRKTERRAKEGDGDGGEDAAELEHLQEQLHQQSEQIKVLEKKLDTSTTELGEASSQINILTVGSEFRRSPWFNTWTDNEKKQRRPKTLLEAEAAEALFGPHFRPNGSDGVLATYTPGGKDTIFNQTDPSKAADPADFDEAFGILFNRWPRRAHYLPSGEPGGMGAREGGDLHGGNGAKTLTRPQFDRLSPAERTKHMKEGGTVTEPASR